MYGLFYECKFLTILFLLLEINATSGHLCRFDVICCIEFYLIILHNQTDFNIAKEKKRKKRKKGKILEPYHFSQICIYEKK
jgi:hypothetical protein